MAPMTTKVTRTTTTCAAGPGELLLLLFFFFPHRPRSQAGLNTSPSRGSKLDAPRARDVSGSDSSLPLPLSSGSHEDRPRRTEQEERAQAEGQHHPCELPEGHLPTRLAEEGQLSSLRRISCVSIFDDSLCPPPIAQSRSAPTLTSGHFRICVLTAPPPPLLRNLSLHRSFLSTIKRTGGRSLAPSPWAATAGRACSTG